MGLSRFLNKQLTRSDGIVSDQNAEVGIINEGGQWSILGGAKIGDGASGIAKVVTTTASLDFAAIQPAGSAGAVVVDMAVAGVAPGDTIIANPCTSLTSAVVWNAVCFSAGAVQVRALHTQSGNLDLASTLWRVTYINFS